MSSLPNFPRSMVEKSPLANDGSNYSDWYLKLCIVLRLEDLLQILDDPTPEPKDPNTPTDAEKEAQKKWKEQEKIVQALILATIGDQLQRKFINHSAKAIMAELEKLFTDSARKERYRTTIALTRCKMVEGEYVSHKSFVMYHCIHKSFISLNEVNNALKTVESYMGKTKENFVLVVASGSKSC